MAVAIGAALAAVLLWYFRETLKQFLSPERTARRIRGWLRGEVPAKGEHFTVLIAVLDGDDSGQRQTRHVADAFEGEHGFRRHLIRHCLREEEFGDTEDARQKAEATGRKWLDDYNADVLVWGKVIPGGKGLILRFVGREASMVPGTQGSGDRRPGHYPLGDTSLPLDFNADMNAVIVALASAAVAPATERQGEYLAGLLEPQAKKLQHLCAHMPAGLDDDQRCSLWHALGLAAGTLGEQKGESIWLEQAVAAFREALKEFTRERVALMWATTQNNLGTALVTLGERDSGTARLDEAVDAYREALKERTRERVPLAWAMTQNNLGTTLATLGERESGTAWLEEAVAAYHEALKEQTRERVPLQWAGTQNNLGSALRALGERESGTARLEEAVAAYREALKERTRERVPLAWAMTQNNLGTALTSVGEREGGTALLAQAVAAYREALNEYTRERVPLAWAMTQNNLGTALVRLGGRESGTAGLKEAVAAFREALKEYTRERVPLMWAATQNNLGTALTALGERESGTAWVEEAVAAFRDALEVFEAGGNLARAEALLRARRGGAAAE